MASMAMGGLTSRLQDDGILWSGICLWKEMTGFLAFVIKRVQPNVAKASQELRGRGVGYVTASMC
jgi:hypothetical protein